MKLTLDNLTSFHTVASEGSFSCAARKLGKSQSTISGAIKNLEQDLGYLLLDRDGHTVTLTDKGKKIYALATPIISKHKELNNIANDLSNSNLTKIKVGIDLLMLNSNVKNALVEFSEEFPEVEINVVTKPSYILGDYINRKKIDIAIGNPYHKTIYNFNIEELFLVNCIWVANKEVVQDSKFNSQKNRLLLLDGYKDIIDFSIISSHNIWVLDDISTILELCSAGKGIALLPQHIIESKSEMNQLIKIPSDTQLFGKQIYASMIWPLHSEFGKYHQWIHNKLRSTYHL
ncbi:LysR family transcriptional regulator [Vibrio sp. 10N.261.46.E12]|uniref:LysR family transcriptional regulator n=2 Tax=Vibrio TaxID=662 RepID=UPI00097647FA|nr:MULTISPECIES: LysR family transcriptional regulator [unclassified Vibrio]OMO34255.1 LysR family transcriptional regulator [Vibrio sp. 10N.261.45.E1]PMJ28158.1 LysR family transcriptional regulator [Vibrio sp. 10N.286.45.B6]PML89093.1 LysR family transcriptional regulator [Vibrio sp. 10N.261.49.E11]PMM71001.1 LysR family transcriptional regulator [Vibrio sp. 10N.261.46.F12]PMM90059.1 LysR family transcriptional regulator [Vibrio sp. 10N.261.46.E8]